MAAIFSFKCSSCDQLHEGSPSFAFRAPDPYLEQPLAVQKAGHLGEEICWYQDIDALHRFIRVCLEVPIHGVSEPFLWGVWVSVNPTNFQRYQDTFAEPDINDRYFAWFCNYLPYYENTYGLKAYVRPRAGQLRPALELELSDHPLALDFHQGISIQKAQEIAESILHRETSH